MEDADRAYASVRLQQEIRRPRDGPEFSYEEATSSWALSFERPDANRLEYKIEVEDQHGERISMNDPANPLTAPGPFGDKSVIEFPDYAPPDWVADNPEAPGEYRELTLSSRILKEEIHCILWTSSPEADPDAARPLLVVHDGLEYDHYSLLTRYLALGVDRDHFPPLRAALLAPVDRNETYSASAAYARALTTEIIPQLGALAPAPPGRNMRVGMGASLGGLAMLHAHRRFPAAFGGLFLQAGSFFRQRYDRYEAGFPRFRRIARFVGTVLAADSWSHSVPVEMTCGSAEENLRNNIAVAEALQRQDYEPGFTIVRDAHNWISWRDSFDPGLGRLLSKVWS